MKKIAMAAVAATIGVAGCAQKAETVAASYVSPLAY